MIQNGRTLLFIASTTEHGSLLGFSFRSTPKVMPGWKKNKTKQKTAKTKTTIVKRLQIKGGLF